MYFSVVLGVVLLVQIYGLLPSSVFYSILGGWLAYLVTAVVIAKGRRIGYPVVVVLAVLTLAVSLPQPAHYSFVSNREILAAVTFITGSAVQVLLSVLVPFFLISERKRAAGEQKIPA